MCTGVEIAALASAAGSAMSAVDGIQQAKHQKAIGRYNQQVAENETIAARQKTEYDVSQQRKQARAVAGAQRAAIAAGGGQMSDFGDVLSMSARESAMDELAIRYSGGIAQSSARQRGTLAKLQANQAATSSMYGAGKSLLTGASTLYGTFGPEGKK